MSWVIRSTVGGAYWISPDLELYHLGYTDTHPGWITRKFNSEGWEGMNAYHDSIDEGWTRMIFHPPDSSLLFEAKDLSTITRALQSLSPEFLNVKHIYVDATGDGKTGEIVVGEGEDALSAWERGVGRLAKGMTFVATEDIEMALETWKAMNPDKKIIGRDPSGIWWDDGSRSTHLTKWEEIRKYTKK